MIANSTKKRVDYSSPVIWFYSYFEFGFRLSQARNKISSSINVTSYKQFQLYLALSNLFYIKTTLSSRTMEDTLWCVTPEAAFPWIEF